MCDVEFHNLLNFSWSIIAGSSIPLGTFASSPSDHSFTQTLIAAPRLDLHPQIICYIVVLKVLKHLLQQQYMDTFIEV